MPAMPSIPGLRKGGEEADAAAAPTTVESPGGASERSVKGSPNDPAKDDDDNSSATGGADSNAEISDNEAEDLEKDGVGVSTKAIQGAKSFGGFLYSAVSKAGAKVSEAGAKIKKTVEENNLLGDFNKEQEAFIKDKNSKGAEAAVPPWVGCPNEESLKEECLSLSTDRRNFVRAPPAGVEFNFEFEVTYPVAQAILAEDPNLEKMRFELVPKVISEENFWRNYFYRVSLICQANELSSLAKEGGAAASASRTSSTDAEPAAAPAAQVDEKSVSYIPDPAADSAESPTNEFLSDTFAASSKDLEEVREGMRKLGLEPPPKEEEWEKELEAELQDYEVVADNDGQNTSSSNWENQIEEMLDDDADLK